MRRTFVTGASSGLGEELARRVAGPGTVVGLCARRRVELERVAARLRELGGEVEVYAVDVTDAEAIADAAHAFVERAGGVDVVVACAGTSMRDRLLEGDAGATGQLVQLNLIGVFNTLLPFVPTMVAQGSGVLVAVGSVAGFRALPGRATYSATKCAVKVLVDGMRMELKGTGVHAMTICPGFVRTPLTDGNAGMMFLQEPDVAADLMIGAIRRQRATYTFPWQMRWIARLLAVLPEGVVRRMAPPPPRASLAPLEER